ncbi:MAG: amidohydrolase [Tannerella sp.]|nr:amidohydrolase [Tannerella sp.]
MKRYMIFIVMALGAAAAEAQEELKKEEVMEMAKAADAYVRHLRGFLHEYPELSGQEVETSEFILGELEQLGLEVTKVRGTGLYAVLDTRRPGKTIGLRADIDALPIPENPLNLKQPKLHVSRRRGVSHACGHDGHTAILLGAARVLSGLKDRLSGRFVFIFEEGEETGSGIEAMIEALRPLGIDAFYGNHLRSSIPSGKIFIRQGAIMAGTGKVEIDILGRGGHASRPDLSVNPVFAAANILTGLSIAWNNQRDLTKTVTLGITQIQGSDIYNVIPNQAFIGGTIRFFDPSEGLRCYDIIAQVASNIAAAHNCTARFGPSHGIFLPPVVNDPSLASFARQAIEELLPGSVIDGEEHIWYAAESFTRYSELAPALFVFPGILNDSLGSGAEHHNDRFDIDEDALLPALAAMIWFAAKL